MPLFIRANKKWAIPGSIFFSILSVFLSFACETTVSADNKKEQRMYKVEKVTRDRCSFELSNKLYLDRIDDSHDPEGYFKISSSGSENMLQLFVFNSSIDVEEKLDAMQESLNTPDIFTATTIEKIYRFGKYNGKGITMKGLYNGGVVKGTIKIFCYGEEGKGFLVIRQTISAGDSKEFDIMENSFQLK